MNTTEIKSFWDRPEGTTGKVIVSGIGLAALAGLYKALPFLITLAENMVYLGVLIGVLFVMYMIATSERVKSLVFYGFNMLCRSITSVFVNIDPVAILEAFVRDMKDKRKVVKTAIESMMAVRNQSERARREKEKEIDDAARMAIVAEDNGMIEKREELTAKIGRRQQYLESLQANIAFANETIEALQRVDRVIEYHINNSTDEAEQLKQDNIMALNMLKATAAANEALGDTDKVDIKNMAADVIRSRVSKATAEVENLLNATRNVQSEMDLTKLTLQANGHAKLNELRQKISTAESGNSVLTKGTDPVYLPAGTSTNVTNKWSARVKVPRNS